MLVDRISRAVTEAGSLYHRLVVVVGPPDVEWNTPLGGLVVELGGSWLNLNLLLAEQLLELSHRERTLRAPQIVSDLVSACSGSFVFLDHLELLFDPSLCLEPVGVLLSLSRARTVVAAWPGTLVAGDLVYAEPGHPEFRRYAKPLGVLLNLA